MSEERSVIEYVILGTSHWVQESSDLEEVLVAVTSKHDIHLIAEENTYHIEATSARRASSRQGIGYVQVDPPPADWAGLRIKREMDLRDQRLHGEDVRLSHADSVREDLWLEKIETKIRNGRVLVVCGYLHVDFLTQKMQDRGHSVVEKAFFPEDLRSRKPEKVLDQAAMEALVRGGNDS